MGDHFRTRCHKFPGIVNDTTIDWFFTWPREALYAVANHLVPFRQEPNKERSDLCTSLVPIDHRDAIVDHMVYVHMSMTNYCIEYIEQQNRAIYITPKHYIDYIRNVFR